MAVRYTTFDGHRVSLAWAAALTAARRDGVRFQLNSGQRSLAEQWVLYRAYQAGTGNLAAFPSPTAPHIRIGSSLHCVDVENSDGGADRLVSWLHRHGVEVTRPVGGESWHIDPSGTNLVGAFPTVLVLKGGMRGSEVGRLVGELMFLNFLPWPVLGRPRSYFGGWVNTAVRNFQRKHGLRADGVVGELTAHRIHQAVAARRAHHVKPTRTSPFGRVR